MLIRRNLALMAGNVAAMGGVSGPPFSAIAADGWQATVASPSDLSLSPATVLRAGYDETGSAVTHTDTVYLTKRVRQVYPNQASFTTDKVALSEYVLSTDTIVGATNNSTLTSPKPIANWAMPQRLVVGSTVHWEIPAFHYFARANAVSIGKQVACIKVRANDGTTQTAWQTVSAVSLSSYIEDAQPTYVYQGDLDVSGLANGRIWLEGEVYPWVGGAASVLKSEDNHTAGVSQRGFVRAYFVKNPTIASAPPLAYVSSTGNDATGVISTTAATAKASPFLTQKGVIEKARATLGATAGAFDGLRIRIMDSVNMGTPSYNTYGWGAGAVIVERDPDTARASAVITVNSSYRPYLTAIATVNEACLTFYDVSIAIGGVYTLTGEASVNLLVQFWNYNLNGGGHATNLRSSSHVASYGGIATNYAGTFSQTSEGQVRCLRGLTADLNSGSPEGWVTVGCSLSEASAPAMSAAADNGHIWFNNKYLDPNSLNVPILFAGSVSGGDLGGVAIVQNLIERLSGTVPGISLSADTAYGNITHAVVQHNTVPGSEGHSRINIAYDDHATVARSHKFLSFKANIAPQLNSKGDVHMTDGTRIGNFAFHHGVGCHANFFKNYDAAAADKVLGPSTLSFGQLYPGLGSVVGGGDPMFTDNKAISGTTASPVTGAGGGTYPLQSGSPAKNLLPAPLLARDLAGNARGTGTQDAGAYI